MGVLTHIINVGGVACVQMFVKGTNINSLPTPSEKIWEHCIRLKALTRATSKYLGIISFSISPYQPAILKNNPAAVKVLRGESVTETILKSLTLLANHNIKN